MSALWLQLENEIVKNVKNVYNVITKWDLTKYDNQQPQQEEKINIITITDIKSSADIILKTSIFFDFIQIPPITQTPSPSKTVTALYLLFAYPTLL